MKSSHVEIGAVYTAKVSGRLVPVRVLENVVRFDRHNRLHTFWRCRNLDTGRQIEVRSAARFRQRVEKVISDYERYQSFSG